MRRYTGIFLFVLGIIYSPSRLDAVAEQRNVESETNIKQSTYDFVRIPEEKEIMMDSLPNGVAVIRDINEPPLTIFSFSTYPDIQKNVMFLYDDINDPYSGDKTLDEIKRRKTGDIMYNYNENAPSLIISSMQVRSLGEKTLASIRNKSITPDFEINQEVTAKLGLSYIIKTVQDKYALFRIIALSKRAIMIQWIYQPDGSTNFTGTGNFLDREVMSSSVGIYTLRNLGLRICFESVNGSNEYKIGATSEIMKKRSIKSLLDELVKKTNLYNWEAIKGTNIICIYPRKNALLKQIVKKSYLNLPETNNPWLSIVEGIHLDKYKIRFPFWNGLSVYTGPLIPDPPNKNITFLLNTDFSIKQILSTICWAYGDGMYFSLSQFENGTKGLVFQTNPPLYELELLKDK